MPLGANKAAIMGVAGVSTADVVLIQSQTASNSAALSFTSGIDSTYGEYIFRFYRINPATDMTTFGFQCNATDSTSYNETITSTFFRAYMSEGAAADVGYEGGADQGQGTAQIMISNDSQLSSAAKADISGEMHLFNPSSTTYVKHFYTRSACLEGSSATVATDIYKAGYVNTTTAIDDVKFYMASGNFDGVIKMWGVK
jgi:hypothetical protein